MPVSSEVATTPGTETEVLVPDITPGWPQPPPPAPGTNPEAVEPAAPPEAGDDNAQEIEALLRKADRFMEGLQAEQSREDRENLAPAEPPVSPLVPAAPAEDSYQRGAGDEPAPPSVHIGSLHVEVVNANGAGGGAPAPRFRTRVMRGAGTGNGRSGMNRRAYGLRQM